eukprot:2232279-Alexandrium_andersonii.AAC.1
MGPPAVSSSVPLFWGVYRPCGLGEGPRGVRGAATPLNSAGNCGKHRKLQEAAGRRKLQEKA